MEEKPFVILHYSVLFFFVRESLFQEKKLVSVQLQNVRIYLKGILNFVQYRDFSRQSSLLILDDRS